MICYQDETMATDPTVTLSIRHVPKQVRDTLVARAEAQGQSLQEYLLALVRTHAERPTRSEVLARIRSRKTRMRNGGVSAKDAARAIREARLERDGETS